MKAVLVKRGVDFGKTHYLDKLSALIGLVKSDQELALLKFYEHSIYWAGRYPIPIKATDEKLKAYWNLSSEVFTSPVRSLQGTTVQFRKSNHADSWENFSATWHEYAAHFF